MAKNRKSSFFDETAEATESPAMAQAAPEAPKAEAAPQESDAAVAKSEPGLLARKFLRGDSGAVAKAFLAEEERLNGIRKLPRAEWKAAWDAFVSKPR